MPKTPSPKRTFDSHMCLPLALAAAAVLSGSCSSEDAPPPAIEYATPGSSSQPSGVGSFRFGAASAATQIEDQNRNVDWYIFTAPEPEGLGRGDFVGDAVFGYSRAAQDIALLTEMNLDAYRFSMEWARIEPQRDAVDEAALAHYRSVLDGLARAGIAPMVTLHHFSNPIWVDDPRAIDCDEGPTDTNLCGFDHETGGDLVVAEAREHAALLAARYGDVVDDWVTVNEPINYLLSAYGLGVFPPGKAALLNDFPRLMRASKRLIAMHAAMYDAIHEFDTVDADGDGVAASVGYAASVAKWIPARRNRLSENPDDIAAVERMNYIYHYLFADSVRNGTFDADLDGTVDEQHPEWANRLDWLGVQYYFRAGVTAQTPLIPGLRGTLCFGGYDLGACIRPEEPTKNVPTMDYEYYEPGVYEILRELATRYDDLPMIVTESGLATNVGRRRAEHVVRSLEQIERAREEGIDVRGYYHWALTDNFEWSFGSGPHFGLYSARAPGFERVATEGATVLGEISRTRTVTSAMRATYGGLGPMTPEPASE